MHNEPTDRARNTKKKEKQTEVRKSSDEGQDVKSVNDYHIDMARQVRKHIPYRHAAHNGTLYELDSHCPS